ncbi:hypothetical protein [Marinoscillum sp. 108]|uniref:hypothetical protein n=1 Tax=Marinoscillum sp. 108 TaxID=2653151 RepID=UPI0012F13D29|nr:hypothetical protein [Marinoscillum sp. 108]VXD16915.1 conserved hypothetical protein [Marinoscillum sp. 108]
MLDFQKKKQLSILVKIAMVDEDFADAEKEVIRKISQKYGATSQELTEIFDSPATAESLAPMTLIDKMDFMMDCILVVIADDMVTSSEEYFARQMATRLGFNQDVVAFLIKNKDVSREEMRELMLPYLVS